MTTISWAAGVYVGATLLAGIVYSCLGLLYVRRRLLQVRVRASSVSFSLHRYVVLSVCLCVITSLWLRTWEMSNTWAAHSVNPWTGLKYAWNTVPV